MEDPSPRGIRRLHAAVPDRVRRPPSDTKACTESPGSRVCPPHLSHQMTKADRSTKPPVGKFETDGVLEGPAMQTHGVAPGGIDALFAGGGEVGELMRGLDWASTPLGPPERWSQSLKTVIRILLTSRFAMWMGWGPELVFLYNDAYAQATLGEKHPWALGRPAREVWAEIWSDIEPRIQTVLDTGVATWDEALLLFLERSGYAEETYHTFSYSPLTDDDGSVVGMFCVVMEETERVIGERRLSTLRELGSALATTSSEAEVFDGVMRALATDPYDLPFTLTYLFDGDGRARLACSTGIEPGHSVAPVVIDLADDRNPSPWPAARILEACGDADADSLLVTGIDVGRGVISGGTWDTPPDRAVVVPVPEQGQEQPAGFIVAALNPFRPYDGAYAGFIDLIAGQVAGSLANARAYAAETRRSAQLEELDRAKTTFFSNVSHELRTPLTLLLAPIEDTLRASLSDSARDGLELAHRNALRLLKLVNTLLDFSRIEAGRVEAVYEPTDLAKYTAELASSFRSATERAGISLVVQQEGPDASSPRVYVDREMWEKIVLNLVSNAFKHTFEGEIRVSVDMRGDFAELTVSDTGVGIAADELPHLFKRFHRVPNARSRTHEGTGIGLALVQELVHLHGGEVRVSSRENHGTTFTVSVPLGAAHLPADRIGAERIRASTMLGAGVFTEQALRWLPDADAHDATVLGDDAPGYDGSGDDGRGPATARILLADDNADMREYAGRLLRSRGWSVEAVPDGQAALEAARRSKPDLVLSDVMMPRLDGFGLLRELREDPSTRSVPIILLSARAGEESRVEGLDAGADDYLVKPFSARELIARVGAHLSLAELRGRALAAVEAAHAKLAQANARLQEQADELGISNTQLKEQADARAIQAAELEAMTEELLERTEEAERQRTAAAMTEARLRSTFDQAPVAIAVLRGPSHRFEVANDRYLQLVGNREILGLTIRDAMPDLEGQGIYELLDEVFASAQPYVGNEMPVLMDQRGDGVMEEVFFNFVYQPLLDTRNDVEGIAVVVTNVTDLVRSRRAAESAQRSAEEANRAKSGFLAAMSHELRTPLNAIAGYAQLMLLGVHGPLTDAQREALGRIERSEQHLLSLINDVLNFAKLEAGRVEYDIRDVPLSDVIDDLASMVEPQLVSKGLSYGADVPRDIVVRADPEKLRQILLNLLSNAVKFTPRGGRITVDAAAHDADTSSGSGGYVAIRVTDTGIGIADEKREKVFEPFVQVHRELTQTTEGTGLGLAISRDLASSMNGDLSVESAVGIGSTFTLRLPLAMVV